MFLNFKHFLYILLTLSGNICYYFFGSQLAHV